MQFPIIEYVVLENNILTSKRSFFYLFLMCSDHATILVDYVWLIWSNFRLFPMSIPIFLSRFRIFDIYQIVSARAT